MEDSRDIDDDSKAVLATELIKSTDLDEVIMEINYLNLDNTIDAQNASTAVLGSWFSTPKKYRIQTLTRMYGFGDSNPDNYAFNSSVDEMDKDRERHYSSKIDVSNDLDNIYGDQHQVCEES